MDDAEILRRAAWPHHPHNWKRHGQCYGLIHCIDCPDDRYLPPFRWFTLPTHVHHHPDTHPGHRTAFWCWDHCRFEDIPTAKTIATWTPAQGLRLVPKGRGGRRPGAGAPRGNANALRHGRRSTRPELTDLLAALPADIRIALLPWLREAAPRMRSIKRRLAWVHPAARYGNPKVIPLRPPDPTATTTTHAVQSNPELDALALRMTSWGFLGAAAFLRRHSPAATVIAQALDYFDQGGADNVRNPGGLLRLLIHEEIADQDGKRLTCPYCPWSGAIGKERTS